MKFEENVEINILFNIQTIATRINTAGGKSPATLCIFKHWVSTQKFHGQTDASLRSLCKCCFRPPLAEPPAHYATRVPLHIGTMLCLPTVSKYTLLCLPTVSKYLPTWPDEKLILPHNSTSRLGEGGGLNNNKNNTTTRNTSLIM